jgi:hypothetical protein
MVNEGRRIDAPRQGVKDEAARAQSNDDGNGFE